MVTILFWIESCPWSGGFWIYLNWSLFSVWEKCLARLCTSNHHVSWSLRIRLDCVCFFTNTWTWKSCPNLCISSPFHLILLSHRCLWSLISLGCSPGTCAAQQCMTQHTLAMACEWHYDYLSINALLSLKLLFVLKKCLNDMTILNREWGYDGLIYSVWLVWNQLLVQYHLYPFACHIPKLIYPINW